MVLTLIFVYFCIDWSHWLDLVWCSCLMPIKSLLVGGWQSLVVVVDEDGGDLVEEVVMDEWFGAKTVVVMGRLVARRMVFCWV